MLWQYAFLRTSRSTYLKNYHNSPNIYPIVTDNQVPFKFTKRNALTIVPVQLNVLCICYSHVLLFLFGAVYHNAIKTGLNRVEHGGKK